MTLTRPSVTLEDKYLAEEGPILLNGIQALVRVLLEQRRLDRRRGLNTAAFVSGYQGSPLGGLDRELTRNRALLADANTRFQAGLNEELAATAVGGTQLLRDLDSRTVDAVTGYWFGKAPGLDRATDAIRHANLSGTAPLGGAVAIIGDDPTSKSSTVPSSSEPLCLSLALPLLAPASVGEIISFGLHAVAMSRHSGLWSGLKIVADIADASGTVDVTGVLDLIPEFEPRSHTSAPMLLPPINLDAEQDQLTTRLDRAREYARAAKLNLAINEIEQPRLAIVAAGMGYSAVVRALWDLGIVDRIGDFGIRLVKLGMPWPLDSEEIRGLVGDAEQILVVEDKRPFLEMLIRDALYGQPDTPPVFGKTLPDGSALLPVRSAVIADDVSAALLRILPELESDSRAADRERRAEDRSAALAGIEALASRTPYFCSGCPHNVSTRAEEDQLVGAGIGCHTMITLDEGGRRGHLLGMTQMGGEGMQWIGISPFTTEKHFFTNIGDGTFHHSGSLAVRAATAAKQHMTFKLLYNDAVAMTGGQDPEGRMAIPQLTRWLALEGVKQVIVTTPEPESYDGVALDPIASVRHRDDLPEVQRQLAEVDGVTVLIHDDRCATEKRRMRKRGKLPVVAEKVWINERVCEGCGDCGEKSSCLSVLPVQTEFGRKTQIHQPSCNSDMTCLKGDCPSFMLITPPEKTAVRPALAEPPVSPAPTRRVPEEILIRMPGIGGTGVVTVSAILQMAAHLDGRHADGLEQIGLAQKGGPVISDIRISHRPIDGQIKASISSIDLLLGLDLLGATSVETLRACEPNLTIAVLNTAAVPTSNMVIDTQISFPQQDIAVRRVQKATRQDEMITLNAEGLAEQLFGDHMPANMLLLGAAFQHGCLPLSEEAIERAIELNGAAVKTTLAAFRWGRAWVSNRAAVEAAVAKDATPTLAQRTSPQATRRVAKQGLTGELGRVTALRYDELVAFQSRRLAESYLGDVVKLAKRETTTFGATGDGRLAVAYAQNAYKLLAYKDEYEVARLHLDQLEQAKREGEFGADADVKILLHPPMLRSMGMKRKLRIPLNIATPLFRTLVALRRLRGTRLDLFGYAEVRKLERELPTEYAELIASALDRASAADYDAVVKIAELPDMVRGYEQIKLDNVERFRAASRAALAQLGSPSPAAPGLELHLSGRA